MRVNRLCNVDKQTLGIREEAGSCTNSLTQLSWEKYTLIQLHT